MRSFVYLGGDGKHYRDDMTQHGEVTLIASDRLTTKYHDDDQSPMQEQLNREKCAHCKVEKEHTQWAHEDEVYG